MSIKTIAIQTEVYDELARLKRGSESFTRTIDRLLREQRERGTCADALQSAMECYETPLSGPEAETMEQVVRERRSATGWNVERPE